MALKHISYPTIHIAGTNGKGQVAKKIAFALQAAGYQVGLFTSPHLFDYEERIQVNAKPISKKDLELHRKANLSSNFFERATLIALDYFLAKGVDVAVFETGLGGRLDPTNQITPLVSIITSISFDHTDRLGTSLEAIAFEKGGIIKPLVPLVLGPKIPSNARRVIQKIAKVHSAPVHQVEGVFELYYEENEQIAKRALELLVPSFPKLSSSDCLAKGGSLPCRFERRGEALFDVAHNQEGFLYLGKALRKIYPKSCFRVVFALGKDKDSEACLAEIAHWAHELHFVPVEEGVDVLQLAKTWKKIAPSIPFTEHQSIAQGVKFGLGQLEKGELLVICGSFRIMKEALEAHKKVRLLEIV